MARNHNGKQDHHNAHANEHNSDDDDDENAFKLGTSNPFRFN